jgi:hypothetical protein
MKRIPEEDEARIRELAEEYDVPLYVVRSLYDVMPNELYDGIVVALEDLEAEGWRGSSTEWTPLLTTRTPRMAKMTNFCD